MRSILMPLRPQPRPAVLRGPIDAWAGAVRLAEQIALLFTPAGAVRAASAAAVGFFGAADLEVRPIGQFWREAAAEDPQLPTPSVPLPLRVAAERSPTHSLVRLVLAERRVATVQAVCAPVICGDAVDGVLTLLYPLGSADVPA